MKLKKRTTALLLCSALIVSMIPVAMAAETDTDAETAEEEAAEEEVVELEEEAALSDLVINVGSEEDSISLTWHSTYDGGDILVWDGEEYTAETNEAQTEGELVNRVTLYDLEANTAYEYYIISGDETSATYTYETGSFGYGEEFSFIAVGDPQIGSSGDDESDGANWVAALEYALSDGTDYSFIFSMGDQVDSYYKTSGSNLTDVEEEYALYLSSPLLTGISMATAVGNHDAGANTTLYSDHFTLPNVSSFGVTIEDMYYEKYLEDGATEAVSDEAAGDYYFTYNGVLFMVLNSSNISVAEHKAFLEETIETVEDYTWSVVVFHKSIYSVASHVSEVDIAVLRTGLSPVFADLDIDVVLQGHDHVYARSYVMGGSNGMVAQVTDEVETEIYDPDGTIYVTLNSASGSKYYSITSEAFTYTTVQNQEKTQNYSSITVDADSFTITTYRVNTGDESTEGTVVDSFTIYKDSYSDDESTCASADYTDVDQTAWYHEAVDSAISSGTMTGTSSTTFEPDSTLTRAQVAQILYNLEGTPSVTATANFSDVSSSAWYSDAVKWVDSVGLMNGIGNNLFDPEAAVTREQLATILYRYAQYTGVYTDKFNVLISQYEAGIDLYEDLLADLSDYTDADEVSSWALTGVQWAVGAEIIQSSSTSSLTINPTGYATRAEFAQMLLRF